MVNIGREHSLLQGEFNPTREGWPTRNERPYMDIPQEPRYSAPLNPGYPMLIETALREGAQVPVKDFVLVVKLENGETRTYTSTSLKPYHQKLFPESFIRLFHDHTRKASGERSYPNSAYSQDGMYNEFDIDSANEYRRQSSSGGESSSDMGRLYRPRQSRVHGHGQDMVGGKRKRTRHPDNDAPIPVPAQKFQPLVIGDAAEVEKYYKGRFKDMQQSSCKVMGKAFVKLVEPKKQTHHPYIKGDTQAPPWWPPTTGENSVRHKEPDHLLKPERIRLLVHILRMIVERPENQCPTVRKLGLNVKKLEDVTMEVMSNWFSEEAHPENAAKRPFLKEIFKVAKAEERYKNGEIDADTEIPIMCGELAGAEESDGEDDGLKEEDDEQGNPVLSHVSTTPDSLVSPTMVPNLQQQSQFDSDPQSLVQSRPHPGMVRNAPHPSHIEDHSPYYSTFNRPMGSFQSHSPGLQDGYRPGFTNPQQSMYAGGWPSTTMGSNGPLPTNCYVTSLPESSLAPPHGGVQLPALQPGPHSQQGIPPTRPYDGLPPVPRHYDLGPALGNQLRTGSLGHPHQLPPSHSFGEYLQDSSSFGHHDSDLKEEQHLRTV